MKNKHYRQGDVLIEEISQIPADAQKQKRCARITLALGEATGHHHDLVTDDPADWWNRGDGAGEEKFVTVPDKATVTHQEHAPIELPPGNYRITRQREYSPAEIRNVMD